MGEIDTKFTTCYLFMILMRNIGWLYSLCVVALGILVGWPLAGINYRPNKLPPAEACDYRMSTGLGSIVGADFDGDMKPDTVVGTAAGRGYVLEIQFSTQIPSASLVFEGLGPGMRILSQDVNRDNDTDLIVTSCTSLIPIAVFLGDGKGHFQQDNPWNYVPVGLNSPYQYNSPSSHEGQASNTTENRRLSAIAWCRGYSDLELDFQSLPQTGIEFPVNQNPGFVCSLRGPPTTSNL